MKKNKKPAQKSGKKPAKTAKKAAKTAVKRARPPRPRAGKTNQTKSQSPAFTKKELEEIKLKLDTMREDLSRNVEDKKNLDMVEPEVGDTIDQATQSLDKEILFELSDNERKMLDTIDASLRKLDNGIYGLCEHCKSPIEKKRLKALPSARYCLPCQNGAEKSRQ
jgi:DnaK suppressor protein